MTIYVQGLSALAHYRSASARTDIERCPLSVRSLTGATASIRRMNEAEIWRLGIGEPTPERPLEVLVYDWRRRTRSRLVRPRVWNSTVPRSAFREVSKEIYVSSPEFVFLQMATRLELPELAALGTELCGTYRRDVELPQLGTNETELVTVYQQPPLSTPRRLRGFVDSMKSAPGCARAERALDFVLPNSASPLETVLYLLLCLPRRLGGYALPSPSLNPRVTLSKEGRTYTLRESARPDLYWRKHRLDLELNSKEFHGEDRRIIDALRRKAFESTGVEVIELTSEELYSESLFHTTVQRIARHLKKRVRSEDEGDFRARRSRLRECLLPSRTEEPSSKTQGESVGDSASAWDEPFDADVEAPDLWVDELPEDESWPDESWAEDDTWKVEVADWETDDLHVFGASGSTQDEPEQEGIATAAPAT